MVGVAGHRERFGAGRHPQLPHVAEAALGRECEAHGTAGEAQALARQPSALQLRYLQTLADISHERTQIIVFPLPLDLIKPFLGAHGD